MENEWKELDIANLPSDILVGDYEFMYLENEYIGYIHKRDRAVIFSNIIDGDKYRYRKRKPQPPSHEEIMTKWWDNFGVWVKVTSYCKEFGYWIFDKINEDDKNEFTSVTKGWFTDRKSADIPPEEN